MDPSPLTPDYIEQPVVQPMMVAFLPLNPLQI